MAEQIDGKYSLNEAHVSEMQLQLIEFFRKPRAMELMRVVGQAIQDRENVINQLYTAFDLSEAVGVRLDFLGALVGELRDGRGDEDFRAAVGAKVLVNLSNGRLEDMLAVAQALLPDVVDIKVIEQYPAALRIELYDAFDGASPATVARMLRQAKPAGVGLTVVAVDIDNSMIWSGAAGSDPDNGWGADWAPIY